MRGPVRNLSHKSFTMGFSGIKYEVGSKSYCRTYISTMIHLCIFGKKYVKLHKNEMVQKGKRMALIYITSMDRVKDIFDLHGLCGVEYMSGGTVHSCAGKVSVVRRGKHRT